MISKQIIYNYNGENRITNTNKNLVSELIDSSEIEKNYSQSDVITNETAKTREFEIIDVDTIADDDDDDDDESSLSLSKEGAFSQWTLQGIEPEIGMALDIMDEDFIWSSAKIVDILPPKNSTTTNTYSNKTTSPTTTTTATTAGNSDHPHQSSNNHDNNEYSNYGKSSESQNDIDVKIRYDGWDETWDEILPYYNNLRLAKVYTYTRRVRCFVDFLVKAKTTTTTFKDDINNNNFTSSCPTPARINGTNLWPCTVRFRMPHPDHSTSQTIAEDLLRTETKVFIQPYGLSQNLLPKYVNPSIQNGGIWLSSSKLRLWKEDISYQQQQQENNNNHLHDTTKGFSQQQQQQQQHKQNESSCIFETTTFHKNFKAAYILAMEDAQHVPGILPQQALEKGSLLHSFLRLHDIPSSIQNNCHHEPTTQYFGALTMTVPQPTYTRPKTESQSLPHPTIISSSLSSSSLNNNNSSQRTNPKPNLNTTPTTSISQFEIITHLAKQLRQEASSTNDILQNSNTRKRPRESLDTKRKRKTLHGITLTQNIYPKYQLTSLNNNNGNKNTKKTMRKLLCASIKKNGNDIFIGSTFKSHSMAVMAIKSAQNNLTKQVYNTLDVANTLYHRKRDLMDVSVKTIVEAVTKYHKDTDYEKGNNGSNPAIILSDPLHHQKVKSFSLHGWTMEHLQYLGNCWDNNCSLEEKIIIFKKAFGDKIIMFENSNSFRQQYNPVSANTINKKSKKKQNMPKKFIRDYKSET